MTVCRAGRNSVMGTLGLSDGHEISRNSFLQSVDEEDTEHIRNLAKPKTAKRSPKHRNSLLLVDTETNTI